MSLTAEFSQPSTITVQRPARPAPFSLRLTEAEKSDLAVRAGGRSVASYIRHCLFRDTPPIPARLSGLPIRDRDALAQILALLGRSRLANNLNQLAYAANIGALPMTPETEEDLRASIADVREMRKLLLSALGMKSGDKP